MTDSKKQVKRYSQSRNDSKTIKYSQIVTDERTYCHRVDEKLTPKQLELLAESLAQEGQQSPMVVIEQGGKYLLIAGHRRFHALAKAIEDNLPNCSSEMDVSVTVMVRGKGQSDDEFATDVLVRSVSDNENRIQFDDFEKLEIAKLLDERKVDANRAMAALGVKDSQYRRYLHIVRTPWLYEAVDSGQIKSTNAARLVEAAKKQDDATDRTEVKNESVNRMDLFQSGFDAWLKIAEHELREANKWRAANKKKALEGKQAHLSRYFTNSLLLHWEKCLEEGMAFDSAQQGGFAFLVNVDVKKLSLEIPRVSLKTDDIDEEALEQVIGGLEDGLVTVSQLLVEVQRKQPVSQDEAEQALARVRAKRQGQKPDESGEPQPVTTVDVSAEIEMQRNMDSTGSKEGDKSDEPKAVEPNDESTANEEQQSMDSTDSEEGDN